MDKFATDDRVPARDKKSVRPFAVTPQERELGFDMDMTNCQGVRTCRSAADICSRC